MSARSLWCAGQARHSNSRNRSRPTSRLLTCSAVDLTETDIRDEIQAELLPQLMDLYAGEWWSAGRTSDDVAHMLQETDLLVTSVHRPSDRLVGFARVITTSLTSRSSSMSSWPGLERFWARLVAR